MIRIALAAVLLVVGALNWWGVLAFPSPWLEQLPIGLGLGLALGWLWERRSAGPGGADGSLRASRSGRIAKRMYKAEHATCNTCRRPLLPGMKTCPFCQPTVPSAGFLESTMHQDYATDSKPKAMPGLAAATHMMLEAGALGFVHVFVGPTAGQSILLSTQTVTIGRARENSMIVAAGGVSQTHAEIRPQGRLFILSDVGSKNGTFVNDQRVGIHTLRSGDVLGIGDARMLVQFR